MANRGHPEDGRNGIVVSKEEKETIMTTTPSFNVQQVSQSCDVMGAENFFQGCSFSPDGLCVLTSTAADGKLRLYNTVFDNNSKDNDSRRWRSALAAFGGDVVRSYAWYPKMSSQDPATCCFAASSRDQPVHLYDAYTGAVRATYRPYNRVDEMESPTVVHFGAGNRILCGGFPSDRVLHIFDAAVPGRDSTILRLGKTRHSSDGQKGLVSALSSTADGRFFAVGTYSPGSIYVYDNRAGHFSNQTVLNGLCVVGHGRSHSRKKRRFVETTTVEDDSLSQSLLGDAFIHQAKAKWFQTRTQGGVTQLRFAPHQEYVLYSASRRSDDILVWDLRMLSSSSSEASATTPIRGIGSFQTASDTNQRLEFDLSPDGNLLFAGGLDRCVRVYDTKTGKLLHTLENLDDVANGVSFTTLSNEESYLAVATGSRKFPSDDHDHDHGDSNETRGLTNAPGYLRLYKLDI